MTGLKCRRGCALRWRELDPEKASSDARHCGLCRRTVFLVRSDAELSLHTGFGHCIALADGYERGQLEPIRIGVFEGPDFYVPRYDATLSAGVGREPTVTQMEGVRLYFEAWPNYSGLREQFRSGGSIALRGLSAEEFDLLSEQMARFGVVVSGKSVAN